MGKIGKLLIAALVFCALTLPAVPAEAAFPGLNGRILFEGERDGNTEIYSMNQDGTDVRRLTNNAAADTYPVWSSDGTKILFTSDRDGDNEIFRMNADGSDQTQLTHNAARDERPDLSPDGSQIIFYSERDGNFEIYLMNADGSNQQNISNNVVSDVHPVWSPDGSKIAFTSIRDGDNEIFIMDEDGGNVTQLTSNTVADSSPDWSPDGQSIVFQSRTGSNRTVARIQVDGTGFVELTSPINNLANPFYSPDGTYIGFNAINGNPSHDLYRINADGSAMQRLTDDPARDAVASVQPLTISPTAVNAQPSLQITSGDSMTYDAPANHTDAYEGIDPTSVTITSQPQKGSVSIDPITGQITYTKQANATGGDSFTYQICSLAHEDLCTDATVGVVLGDITLAETGSSTLGLTAFASVILSTSVVIAIVKRN